MRTCSNSQIKNLRRAWLDWTKERQSSPASSIGQPDAPGKPHKQDMKASAILQCCVPQQLLLGDVPPVQVEAPSSHHGYSPLVELTVTSQRARHRPMSPIGCRDPARSEPLTWFINFQMNQHSEFSQHRREPRS